MTSLSNDRRLYAPHRFAAYTGEDIGMEPPVNPRFWPPLTKREVQVLYMLSRDMTSREVGEYFSTAPSTIDAQGKSIMRKMGVHTRGGAIAKALRMGLIE